MKRNILLFVFFIFNVSLAQTPNWIWAKNISLIFNDKEDVTAVDNEGNVYLIGDFRLPTTTIGETTITNSSNPNYTDAYILKFNSSGLLLWWKQLGGSKNEEIKSIGSDNNGNIYIIGSYGSSITLGSTTLNGTSGFGGVFIAKLNSNGDYLWAIANNGTNENFKFYDIKADNSGNVFLTGSVKSPTLTFGNVVMSLDSTNPTVNDSRVFLAKFNTNGECIWGKVGIHSESENSFTSIPSSIAPDNNGGAAICGYFSVNELSFGSITLTKTTQNNNNSNMFVAKFDSEGNEEWASNAGTVYLKNTGANALTIDSLGNVYAGGFFTNSITIGTTLITAVLGTQFFLVKYNQNGTVDWAKTSGYNTNLGFSLVHSIDTDINNNVYIAGITYATTLDFTNNLLLNFGSGGGLFITKYNSLGIPIWAKGINDVQSNNFIFIDCKAENDLYVGGSFNTSTAIFDNTILTKSMAHQDLFLSRLYAQPLDVSSFDNNAISIFPNPTHENINLTNLKRTYTYNLYNVLGECVKQGNMNNEKETIAVSNLQYGLYILMLTDKDGDTTKKKIVIH